MNPYYAFWREAKGCWRVARFAFQGATHRETVADYTTRAEANRVCRELNVKVGALVF